MTVDFAPSIDVSNESDDEVIGDRSFSNDPNVVTRFGGAFARGLADAGIIPVYKHFPGHGHGSGDSHLGWCRLRRWRRCRTTTWSRSAGYWPIRARPRRWSVTSSCRG